MTDVLIPHIQMKQGALGLKPYIAGKGINISALAVWYEELGMSVEDLIREYNLTRAEVHAGLAYYYDHKDEIDRQIAREKNVIEDLKREPESDLQKKLKSLKEQLGG